MAYNISLRVPALTRGSRLSVTTGSLLILLSGCGPEHMPAATPVIPPASVTIPTQQYAGVAAADVTPPPGVATFGHGPDARVAAGYFTRLQCRAFVLLTQKGSPVALVPCELAAVSTLLQRSVVARLRAEGIDIPPQRLFISAVHTHAGPAHYFDAQFYGDFASSQGPGFDPDMVEFLSERIAGAVGQAYRSAQKALADERVAQLRWIHGKFWGLTHNRSLSAYALNQPLMDEGQPPDDIAPELDPASRAIDPNIDILEIEEKLPGASQVPVGWVGFLAMHPTVLPNTNRLFGGDVFGVTSRILEQELRRFVGTIGSARGWPLVGLINTNEGDLSPRWSTGNRGETLTFGRRLASEFLRIHRDSGPTVPFKNRVVFSTSTQEVRLPNNGFGLPFGQSLCSRGELGVASFWGASDHPTSLSVLGDLTAPSIDLGRNDCQRPKREALGVLQQLFAGQYSFPTVVPLGVALLDDTWIAFAPAELTSTTGWRIRKALLGVKSRTPDGRQMEARIAGLTNGYMEYVATEEEYQLQLYEGASTLYGPNTAKFLRLAFTNVAQRMLGQSPAGIGDIPPDVASSIDYRPGPTRHRLPKGEVGRISARSIGTCRIAPAAQGSPPSICFTWVDGPGHLHWSPPYRPVSIVAVDPNWKRLTWRAIVPNALAGNDHPDPIFLDDPAVIRDDGFEFVTAIRAKSAHGWIWASVFEPTAEEWNILQDVTQKVVFQVGSVLQPPIVQSKPFGFSQVDLQMPACTAAEARICAVE